MSGHSFQRNFPRPLTDNNKGFMAYIMAGVRAKREQAIQRRAAGGIHPSQGKSGAASIKIEVTNGK